RREVVAAALDQQQLRLHLVHQFLERHEVVADVLANRRVRTAARLDGADSMCVEGLVSDEKLRVLAREDVVGDDAEAVRAAQPLAEREHQRGLAAADRSSDADGEAARRVIARQRHIALVKEAGVIVMFMRVRMSGLVHVIPYEINNLEYSLPCAACHRSINGDVCAASSIAKSPHRRMVRSRSSPRSERM